MYPVMLDMRGKGCLVVGGGPVALRKVEGLLADGAVLTIVASDPAQALLDMEKAGRLRLERREYRAGEAADSGYALVFAATDDRQVNKRVFEDADGAGIWANVADDPEICSFHLPARIRRGVFQLTVASAGEAPFVVRRMRQLLERRFGPEWGEWAEAAARFRASVRLANLDPSAQEGCFDRFFASTVDADSIQARVPSAEEEADWLGCSERKTVAPDHEAPETHRADGAKGLVSLVGGGPGDAGLLTVRARQRMLTADALVYDRLAATVLPWDLPPEVELHPVGKRAKHHPMPQEEINALLIRLGREGKQVVRLKGGDPFVFGRGGEEALALSEAGIPFEVIPSVTAGVAVPAYAGIPVTHRGQVVRLTLVTAHESDKQEGPQVRWDLLAKDPHATLVGYMGVTSLPLVAKRLMDAGLSPKTPAALIQRGTTSRQRTVVATIEDLHERGKAEGLKPPAIFVIGPTVALADRIGWFDRRPLHGQRLVVAGPAGSLGVALELAGVEVVEVPMPVSEAARVVMGALPVTGCVLRDAGEADGFEDDRDGAGWGPDVVAWCLTPETAERAVELGWSRVVGLDSGSDGGALVVAMTRWVKTP